MRPLFQPSGSNLCGQTCVAMIAEVSLQRVCTVMGHSHSTRTREIVTVLRALGIECSDRLQRISKQTRFPARDPLPKRCIVHVVWDKPNGGYHRHWIVYWNGQIFNPDPGSGYRMTSFLEIRGRNESA